MPTRKLTRKSFEPVRVTDSAINADRTIPRFLAEGDTDRYSILTGRKATDSRGFPLPLKTRAEGEALADTDADGAGDTDTPATH